MTIASEISKLQENLINAYSSIESKGGTLPANQNFDNLSSSINTITGGSSNIITAINNTGELISKDDKVWINEENGSYSIVDFDSLGFNFGFSSNSSGTTVNIDNTTHVASGFTSNTYLAYPGYIRKNKVVHYHKIYTGSLATSVTYNIYEYNSYDMLEIYEGASTFRTYNWGNNNYVNLLNNVASNTLYYIKIVVDYPKKEYYYSTDGISYTKMGETTDTTISINQGPCFVGRNWNGATYFSPSGGYIDLEGEYVEDFDGNRIWSALKGPNITRNSLTGYAHENIASGSSGEVLTLI